MKNLGFSLIEVIIAIAIFAIISAGTITGFIPILISNRQSSEIQIANNLAQEGIEAARSIRNRDFNLLTVGAKGIGVSSGLWAFNGSSDVTDKYTRQISITGTTNPDSFIINSLVTWKFLGNETKSFSQTTTLTNWQKVIAGIMNYDGLMIYSSGTTTTPYWRSYTTSSNLLGAETAMPALTGNPRNIVIRTSPQKTEAIVGVGTSAGILYVYCFDGTSWTQDWSATIGGNASTRRFDIAFENTTGDAIVLYSSNTPTTNELNFRKKLGSSDCGSGSWTGAAAFDPVQTSGLVSWVKMSSNPIAGSNLIAALWADWNKDLSGAVWNGTTFQNEMLSVGETKIESINTGTTFPDVESLDLAYESVTGDLVTIWGTSSGTNGTSGVRYRLCTGNSPSCVWGTVTTPPTFADDATNLDLSANPNTDEMVFASIGNAGSDMQIGYWSGVGWTNTANVDISTQAPLAGTKLIATNWLISGSTTRSVIVYNDSGATNTGWYTGNRGVFSAAADVGVVTFATPQKWYELSNNPKSKDKLIFSLSDNASDLFVRSLSMNVGGTFTWAAPNGNVAVEPNLGQATVKPFGFAFWIK